MTKIVEVIRTLKNEGDKRLVIAIERNNREEVGRLTREKDLNREDDNGLTPLEYAVLFERPNILELLFKSGPIAYASEKALVLAAEQHRSGPLKILLEQGAFNADRKHDALTRAIAPLTRGRDMNEFPAWEAIRLLLEFGAPVFLNASCPVSTLLKLNGPPTPERKRLLEMLFQYGGPEFAATRGATLLMDAVVSGDESAANILLAAGARFPERYADGKSVLFYLEMNCRWDLLTRARLQLLRKPYPDSPEGLVTAIAGGAADEIERLLAEGVDPNDCSRSECSPLTMAAKHESGNFKARAIRMLVEAGADLNQPFGERWDGCTALEAAVHNGDANLVRLLIELGADVNLYYEANTPLFIAVTMRHQEIVRDLLEARADPRTQCYRYSPAGRSAHQGEREIMEMMLTALEKYPNGEGTRSEMLRAAIYARRESIVVFLLDRFPSLINEPETLTGETPINGAVVREDTRMMRILMGRGSRPPAELPFLKQIRAGSPMLEAALKSDLDKVRGLTVSGAKVDTRARDGGWTPLHHACFRNRPDDEGAKIARLLLEHGAVPDTTNEYGETPLMIAAQFGSLEVFRTLLEFARDLAPIKDDGRDVYALAAMRKHPEFLEALPKS